VIAAIAGALLLAACSQSTTTSAPAESQPANGAASAGTTAPTAKPVDRSSTPSGPIPTVSGPVTGGTGKINSAAPAKLLGDAGYVEEEYFLNGTASSYTADGTWDPNGQWKVTPDQTVDYTTRAIVRRPSDPKKFNGSVFVEWLNVSGGADVGWDFGYLTRELLDQGYIYVGVTAQKVGSDAAKNADAARYAPLVHPGDQYSYDMYTQAGRAVLANKLFDPTYQVRKIIADGESQSAGRMVTYINAIQPTADIYDAFLVHSRGDRTTPIAPGQPSPNGTHVRTDLRSPTLVVLTETDVIGNQASRQPDDDKYRRWEIAGSAHVDNNDISTLAGTDPGEQAAITKSCAKPNNVARQYLVMDAALRHLNDWVNGGPTPPGGAPLAVDSGHYVLDDHGNATGGIRLPEVVAPIAVSSGLGNSGGQFCVLFGSNVAFDPAVVRQLYPTHDDFVQAYSRAVDDLVTKGYALERDAPEAKAGAQAAPVPS
jgi:hypothetical protein